MMRIEHLKKQYGDNLVLNDISLSLDDEVTCILGPSGAGKSTFLRCLNLLESPTGGDIKYNGQSILQPGYDIRKMREEVTMVFQHFNLFPLRNVVGNVMLALQSVKHMKKADAHDIAMEMLKKVDMADKAEKMPDMLSGGQQQRVAIARALSKRPDVLLLDEPLSNLDAKLRVEMREEIRRIQREAGITTVFVTHDQEEASSIADRVVLLRDGVLQQEDTARGLYENPVTLFAADFLGTPPINLLHGVVQNGRLVLDGGIPAALALPDGLAEGQEIVLAVRAESILPQGDTPAFRTTVLERYSLGKDELVRLQAGPAELRGLVPAELEILPGAELAVGLKKRGVFLFDAKTGVRYL